MAQTGVVKPKRTLAEKLNEEHIAGMICTAPFTIGFLLFMIVPMLISAYYAFCDFDILSPAVWTGLANFKTMFSEAKFWKSLGVTFYFAFVSVPLRLVFALIVALILLRTTKITALYRAV